MGKRDPVLVGKLAVPRHYPESLILRDPSRLVRGRVCPLSPGDFGLRRLRGGGPPPRLLHRLRRGIGDECLAALLKSPCEGAEVEPSPIVRYVAEYHFVEGVPVHHA